MKRTTTRVENILKDINKMCFTKPLKLEDTNNLTWVLATLVYIKLKQQTIRDAHQFEAATRYKINQKCLSEILHRKKHLDSKQKRWNS